MNSAEISVDHGDSRGRGADAALTAALCYFVLAAATIHLTSDGRNHATMWPADAVILALLLQHARKHWPVILAAGWVANLAANAVTRGWSIGVLPYGAINMAQSCIAALILTRAGRVDNLLRDLPTVAIFILSAGIVAPLLGALAGSVVSMVNYGEPFGPQVLRWFMGNSMGYLIATPCLAALFDGSYVRNIQKMSRMQRLEVLVLHASHAITAYVVFAVARMPLLFLPITTLTLLAFRTGRLGIQLGIVILALVGAVQTFLGHGPLNMIAGDLQLRDFYFQVYVAVLLLTALPIGAAVSTRTEALQIVAERGEALRLILGQSRDVVLGFDGNGACRWADGPIERLIGIDRAAILGRTTEVLCLLAPPALGRMLADVERIAEGGERLEFTPLLRSHLTVEAAVSPIPRTADTAGFVIVLRDVTERKAAERAVRAEAQTDDVTGVLTRPSFRRIGATTKRKGGASCLALIDIDQFNSINETYGHEVGNAVLGEIARRLAVHLRETDIIGRMGHDEFAILFECDLATARTIGERLIEAVRSTPVYTRDTVSIIATISCGMTTLDQTIGLDDAFEAADRALREIRRTGRNGILIAA
ncbi:diguanylate cyclase [Novosphingobium colocasiae]|uniref:diguanylate cyclase n=1 Tax=Novosphingobium colocasiae TaxID=1256513 RepID=A0A918PK87_9SPHN|nr:sensor domain-containing diguanylate cyclase [Novosphingobium colocasiae]GGZ13690.1 hypothetical protein GCM10011614_30930 [Novosphingobium colocasiae]